MLVRRPEIGARHAVGQIPEARDQVGGV